MIRSVAVFCGSRTGANPNFMRQAIEVGELLARRNLELVYGGGEVGLMGAVANACLRGGGRAIGVIPKGLFEKEILHEGLTELHVTDSMHARKAKMAERADAFLTLPGGFGTLDELCEIVTWAQLGIHAKPIALLNTDGFWDGFLEFSKTAVDQGFIPRTHFENLKVARTPEDALDLLVE